MGRVAVAMLVALCAAPAVAAADSPLDWRFGIAAGLVRDSLGGNDADLAGHAYGTGGLIAGRVTVGVPDVPVLVRVDPGLALRRADDLHFYHLEAPVLAQLEHRLDHVRPFAAAGVEIGWAIAGSYFAGGEVEERQDLDIDPLHFAAIAGAGVGIPNGRSTWTVEIRYSHGLRTIDSDSPGLDIRHRTWVVVGGIEW